MSKRVGVNWVTKDARLLIAASAVRALGQGFLSVSLAVYLAETATDARRTDTFALYRIVNTVSRAFGALAAIDANGSETQLPSDRRRLRTARLRVTRVLSAVLARHGRSSRR